MKKELYLGLDVHKDCIAIEVELDALSADKRAAETDTDVIGEWTAALQPAQAGASA